MYSMAEFYDGLADTEECDQLDEVHYFKSLGLTKSELENMLAELEQKALARMQSPKPERETLGNRTTSTTNIHVCPAQTRHL